MHLASVLSTLFAAGSINSQRVGGSYIDLFGVTARANSTLARARSLESTAPYFGSCVTNL